MQKKNAWLFQRKSARTLSKKKCSHSFKEKVLALFQRDHNGGNNRNALCSLSPCRVGGHLQSAPSLQPPTSTPNPPPHPHPQNIFSNISPPDVEPPADSSMYIGGPKQWLPTHASFAGSMVGGWVVIWVHMVGPWWLYGCPMHWLLLPRGGDGRLAS